MSYRTDRDLEILYSAEKEDLEILIHYLTRDNDGSPRLTEELTPKLVYKSSTEYPRMYWTEIAEELQRFGGNTFVNMFRGGKGVLYREILCDVCDKLKVNYNSAATTEMIEANLFQKILTDAVYKMDDAAMKETIEALDLETTNFTKQGMVLALQMAIRAAGFTPYRFAMIVANQVAKEVAKRGLAFGMNAGLNRAIGVFAGPLGLVFTALWTAVDIAGPAYRVTIPSVIHVAYIRAKGHMNDNAK